MTTSLDAAGLHAAARGTAVPAEFITAGERVEHAERAYRDAVRARHELIREARTLGVPWVALARWTGFNVKTLREIVEGS